MVLFSDSWVICVQFVIAFFYLVYVFTLFSQVDTNCWIKHGTRQSIRVKSFILYKHPQVFFYVCLLESLITYHNTLVGNRWFLWYELLYSIEPLEIHNTVFLQWVKNKYFIMMLYVILVSVTAVWHPSLSPDNRCGNCYKIVESILRTVMYSTH